MEKLLELTYSYDALEPTIDALTMETHHSKHLNAYVTNYNAAIEGTDYAGQSLNEVLTKLDTLPPAVRNNGGGVFYHNLFFTQLKPGVSLTDEKLIADIDATFGSLDALKEELQKAGATQFGSGWSILALNKDKKLEVIKMPNQDAPLHLGYTPLLVIDVWEHAYYLTYQNRRPEYLTKIFDVIDWDVIAERYNKSK